MVARNMEKMQQKCQEIKTAYPNIKTAIIKADLGKMCSLDEYK